MIIKSKWLTRLVLAVLICTLVLAFPSTAAAQETDPPRELIDDEGVSDEDILVIEPQFYLEFPFAQGFKISFNFGITIEVPRRLILVNNDILNFFLRFQSYVIPAEGEIEATTSPEVTPED
jgi:hypothetical protein